MKKFIILIVILIFAKTVSSQVVISYDTVFTNTVSSKSFYVKNPTNQVLQVTAIKTLTSNFYFNTTPFNINPFDSVQVMVYFKTNQNLTFRDFLIFETKKYKQSIVFYSLATAKYTDTIYKFTQGLIDEVLKSALKSYATTGYVALGYNTARDRMYETVDDYNNNDTLQCVYTGRKIHAANRTEAQNLGFQCEHTYPQSYFSEREPMKSDIYHLYPTDGPANNRRSNYPFGFVVSNITWDSGGSKLGNDNTGQKVFEPRNPHKGNVARSIFYFCVKYFGQIDTTFMSWKQENVLRQFNVLDTVDAKERMRNNKISSYVHVRNPFIDHPEFIDRMRSCYRVLQTVTAPKVAVSPGSVEFDTLAVNDTASYYLAIMNRGTSTLNITSASSNASQFIVESSPLSIPQSELRFLKIKFKPNTANQTFTGTLNIQNSDSNITISMKGYSKNPTGINAISSDIPNEYKLFQNYPNPFNPVTIIKFQIPESENGNSFISLKIFDITGKEIAALVNENLKPGIYEVPFKTTNLNLSSGIYYYKLKSGDFQEVKKLMLVK